jgi:flavin-binding protein dodecin
MSIEAMKMALALNAWTHFGECRATDGPIPTPTEVDAALRQAIELAQKQEQKVDWEKLYRLEVKKKEALVAKYERDIKPLTRIIPMAQKQEPVQVTIKYFVATVEGKEDFVGRPVYWAQWPNEDDKGEQA